MWDSVPVALKRLKTESDMVEFEHEVKILRTLRHPNIIQYYGIYIDEANLKYIMMEYLPFGSLLGLVRMKKHELNTYTLSYM